MTLYRTAKLHIIKSDGTLDDAAQVEFEVDELSYFYDKNNEQKIFAVLRIIK